jgi:hypothetical protein
MSLPLRAGSNSQFKIGNFFMEFPKNKPTTNKRGRHVTKFPKHELTIVKIGNVS